MTIEQLLQGMPGVFCYHYDMLISAISAEEHEKRLCTVLGMLQSAGLKLQLDKCTIGVSQVSYLTYHFDEQGLHPTAEEVQGISKAPLPTNKTQIYKTHPHLYRSYLSK